MEVAITTHSYLLVAGRFVYSHLVSEMQDKLGVGTSDDAWVHQLDRPISQPRPSMLHTPARTEVVF